MTFQKHWITLDIPQCTAMCSKFKIALLSVKISNKKKVVFKKLLILDIELAMGNRGYLLTYSCYP